MRLVNYFKNGGPTGLKQKKDYIFNRLVSAGISDFHAAAILGNLLVENDTLEPGRVNESDPKSNALGIAQWLGPRQTRLIQEYGLEGARNFENQVEYLVREILDKRYARDAWKGTKNFNEFIRSNNIKDATVSFSDLFERAGDHEKNNPRRLNTAIQLYLEYVGEAPPMPTGSDAQARYGMGSEMSPMDIKNIYQNSQGQSVYVDPATFKVMHVSDPSSPFRYQQEEGAKKEEEGEKEPTMTQAQQEMIARDNMRKEIINSIPVLGGVQMGRKPLDIQPITII